MEKSMTQQVSACDSRDPVYNGLTGLVSEIIRLKWYVLVCT